MGSEINKHLFFNNIAYLLKEKGIRIGEFESEAGVSLGYISRSIKDPKTKPGIDFIIRAAEILDVEIDTLIRVNLSDLNPSEKYVSGFLYKLIKDTCNDKVNWICETQQYFDNYAKTARYNQIDHPLLSFKSYIDYIGGHDNRVSRILFCSKAYGNNTFINGDCFKSLLKNDTTLYLMSICNSVRLANEVKQYCKELWFYSPETGAKYLCNTAENPYYQKLIDNLYSQIQKKQKTPKLDKEIISIIDSYMREDLSND